MEKENGNSTEITVDDILSLPDPSPSFRIWIWKMMSNGHLDQIVKVFITADVVKNGREALNYLNEMNKERDFEDLNLSCCDFKNETNLRLLKRLDLLLGSNNNQKGDPYQIYGTVGHSIMSNIFSGQIGNRYFGFVKKNGAQLSLFEDNFSTHQEPISTKSLQMNLFEADTFEIPLTWKEEIIGSNIPQYFPSVARIEKIWHRIIEIIDKSKSEWPNWYLKANKYLNKLRNLLGPLFGRHAHLFDWRIGSNLNYSIALSLMSLAGAIVFFRQKEKMALFTETPVISIRHKFGGGRIDAIEIRTIGGKPPNKKQIRLLKEISKYRFESVGRLAYDLSRVFRQKIEFNIFDWKFAVGDGKRQQIIQPIDVPIADHVVQLKKYLALSSLSYSLQARKKDKNLWTGFNHGTLFYFMPNSPPILHQVAMDPDQNEKTFLKEIVLKWDDAKQRAIIRHMNNHLIGHAIQLLENKKAENHSPENKKNNFSKKVFLFPEIEERHSTVALVVEKYHKQDLRRFIDSLKIVEQVNEKLLVMHVDRLLKAIEQEEVVTSGIRARGGFIRCLMPDHDDTSPSMHISFTRNQFKCFSCGAWGTLISIPSEIKEEIASMSATRNYFDARKNISAEVKKIVIPESHQKVMETAQELLQSQFKRSEAEYYIVKKRYIDSDLAFSLGAGYGNSALINGLLDIGLTLDELIFYGFVGISEKIGHSQGIAPILRRRGIRDKNIKRPVNVLLLKKKFREKLKDSMGYPYFVLERRITFPLKLAGKTTNFYGRATYQCNSIFNHRKLYTGNSGVPQGGFNMETINSENKEISITESVIDALSMIMLKIADSKSVTALIGVANYLIAEELIDSGKNIALALNLDVSKSKTGQKATAKLIEYFQKRSKQKVKDFTAEFMARYPEMPDEYKKDYNKFLEFKVKNLKI